ncbi:MAG: hypothetical protein K2H33_03760 [Muribaculaceae bacterium]|nr:hypothetical protein [Muribaculaceae bacterium]
MATSTERTVIHLEKDGQHYYFGSLASVFDHFTNDELGIGYGALRNYGITSDKPYINSKCIIRKGVLLQKAGGRGKKPTQSE